MADKIVVGKATVAGKGSLSICYDPETHLHSYTTPGGRSGGQSETFGATLRLAQDWLRGQADDDPVWVRVTVVVSQRAPKLSPSIFTTQYTDNPLAGLYEAEVAISGGQWQMRGYGYNDPSRALVMPLGVPAEVQLPFVVEAPDGVNFANVFAYDQRIHQGLSWQISALRDLLHEYVGKGVAAACDGRAARDPQQVNWRESQVMTERLQRLLADLY